MQPQVERHDPKDLKVSENNGTGKTSILWLRYLGKIASKNLPTNSSQTKKTKTEVDRTKEKWIGWGKERWDVLK